MGEENRGSSGSSTAMIVIAILGGVLLLVSCGGIAVVGGGVLFYRSARNVEMEVQRSSQEMRKASDEMSEKLHQEMKLPEAPPNVPLPEIAPGPAPSPEEKKE